MLLIRILQKSTFSDLSIASRNFRNVNRSSNRGKSINQLQPPASPVYEANQLNLRSLFKPFVFTVCFSGGAYLCSAVWQYEDMRRKAFKKMNSWLDSDYSPHYKKGEIRRKIHYWWQGQTEGQKIALSIIAMNLCVFLFWRVPYLEPFMLKYFCSSPAKRTKCLPMFFSTFSHYSTLHLFANMYVLYSFSSSSVAYLGKEQFVALYCSAGVISSFTSYLCKIYSSRASASLGASGAIMAILSSYCLQFPHAELGIILIPFFTIPAHFALKGIIALDTIGVFAKWRFLDHAAHLGGSLWGIFYLTYGCHYIWGNREILITRWHSFRNK